MPVGDVSVDVLSIGPLDLTNPAVCQYISFEIYEDLFDPYGPTANIWVNDFNDAIANLNIDGKEAISIAISTNKGSATFDMRCYECIDYDDRSVQVKGSMKSKQYKIIARSPEYLVAQKKGTIQFAAKGAGELVSSMIQRLVLTEGFESIKPFICNDTTSYPINFVKSGEPIDVHNALNHEAVSITNKSSLYKLFVSDQKYIYSTIEQLCLNGAKATYVQTTTLGTTGTTDDQKLYSITNIIIPRLFFTPIRAKLTGTFKAYCPVTGKATFPQIIADVGFKFLGIPYAVPLEGTTDQTSQTAFCQHDRINNKTPTGKAEAEVYREAYRAHFEQNYATMTINGNPNIKLGDIINLVIPQKATNSSGEEVQFNGPVLVINIRHKINPISTQPRYQMELRVSKAGGFGESTGIGVS